MYTVAWLLTCHMERYQELNNKADHKHTHKDKEGT